MNIHLNKQELTQLLNIFDENNDGFISLDEFSEILIDKPIFKLMNENLVEICRIIAHNELTISQGIDVLFTNNDFISKDEMLEGFRKLKPDLIYDDFI